MSATLSKQDLQGLVSALGAEEALGNLKVSDLKAYCKEFGLKTIGSKAELITSLADHLSAAAGKTVPSKRGRPQAAMATKAEAPPKRGRAAAKAPATAEPKRGRAAKATKASAGMKAERQAKSSVTFDVAAVLGALSAAELAETLQAAAVSELVDYCTQLGLESTGDKVALTSRVEDHIKAASNVAAPTAESVADVAQEAPMEVAAEAEAAAAPIAEAASDAEAPCSEGPAATAEAAAPEAKAEATMDEAAAQGAQHEAEADATEAASVVDGEAPMARVESAPEAQKEAT
eukprot:CAMPEP_0176094538 /NCGR_PEP_ID=MMETSP0120_2-20121206/47373_1 /TAXON_ID=160619 /ORGANISM="Kryptoperidinium foliaceum, Strain CCMP 1326" /LENGTH=289 /DNA_ID=CAMNT_0017428479 /DNA_START=33 /DNA_END=898 /DNA_ORIENTATION=+